MASGMPICTCVFSQDHRHPPKQKHPHPLRVSHTSYVTGSRLVQSQGAPSPSCLCRAVPCLLLAGESPDLGSQPSTCSPTGQQETEVHR